MARNNYLNNKDLLAEIHKSKNSYNYFIDNKYQMFDCIVLDVNEITSDKIKEIVISKAAKLTTQGRADIKSNNGPKRTLLKYKVTPEDIEITELVFRVMNADHIPIDEATRDKKELQGVEYTEADTKTRTNFLPFKHYVIESFFKNRLGNYKELVIKEVGRSHWIGGFDNGHFSMSHGNYTDKLALMYMKLVERYGTRGNWVGYSYNDEMRAQALLQLTQVGLQFNEQRSDNPFAYYTTVVTNSFTKIFNLEKKSQTIRDDLLIETGASPSYTRQVADEFALKQLEKDAGWV